MTDSVLEPEERQQWGHAFRRYAQAAELLNNELRQAFHADHEADLRRALLNAWADAYWPRTVHVPLSHTIETTLKKQADAMGRMADDITGETDE